MHDLFHRLAVALLFMAGLATLVEAAAAGPAPDTLWLRHHQVLVALTGAALAVATWWPPLRAPALGAGLLSKLALLAVALLHGPDYTGSPWLALQILLIVLLATAGVILAREARQEARWNMGWRQEG